MCEYVRVRVSGVCPRVAACVLGACTHLCVPRRACVFCMWVLGALREALADGSSSLFCLVVELDSRP